MPTTLPAVTSHGLLGGSDCDYPSEDDVRSGVTYDDGDLTGNLVLPDEDVVLEGETYGSNNTEFTGTLRCLTPPPDPATAGDTPFALIHLQVVTRVAQALNMPLAYVRPVASENYAVTAMENLFAYVRTYGLSPVDPTTGAYYPDDGAGRWRRVIGRRIRIYLYTRSGVDVYGGDEVALGGVDPTQVVTTPPTMPGQFVLEEILVNALDNWTPTYVDDLSVTRPLTIGPVHLVDSEGGPPVREPENEAGLIRSHIDVQICYRLNIQRVEPAPEGLPAPNQGN
jgi:hypothetical protein